MYSNTDWHADAVKLNVVLHLFFCQPQLKLSSHFGPQRLNAVNSMDQNRGLSTDKAPIQRELTETSFRPCHGIVFLLLLIYLF